MYRAVIYYFKSFNVINSGKYNQHCINIKITFLNLINNIHKLTLQLYAFLFCNYCNLILYNVFKNVIVKFLFIKYILIDK